MTTLVISDLHLGAATRNDLVALAEPRARLLAEVEQAERVVLLGDVLELRDRPTRQALEIAEPFLRELGSALGKGRELVLTAGNHDHHLFASQLEERRLRTSEPLGLEHELATTGLLDRLAAAVSPAVLRPFYPGIWLRDDVYATHGHYLDAHITLPTFERLGVGAIERVLGRLGGSEITPDDHEAVQTPIYALLHALAQARDPDRDGGASTSVRLWRLLGGAHGKRQGVRGWLLGAVIMPGAVGVANRLGLGPVRADVSGAEVAEAGARAMREAVRRLGIEARHVIFGHTHRRGPLPGDPLVPDWAPQGEPALHNTGAWTYTPSIMEQASPRSPYWPGSCVTFGDSGPPELRELLADLEAEAFAA